MVIYSNFMVNLLTLWHDEMFAVTVWPFIFVRPRFKNTRYNKYLLNHERIHLKQQEELFIVGFYILYFGWYIWKRIDIEIHYRHLSREQEYFSAYKHIIFERETYKHESDLSYLQTRKPYAFWRE